MVRAPSPRCPPCPAPPPRADCWPCAASAAVGSHQEWGVEAANAVCGRQDNMRPSQPNPRVFADGARVLARVLGWLLTQRERPRRGRAVQQQPEQRPGTQPVQPARFLRSYLAYCAISIAETGWCGPAGTPRRDRPRRRGRSGKWAAGAWRTPGLSAGACRCKHTDTRTGCGTCVRRQVQRGGAKEA
jgi:hypothetical protein